MSNICGEKKPSDGKFVKFGLFRLYFSDSVSFFFNQLKLGFIAQSCLSPGFSTLLANVFSMRSHETVSCSKLWNIGITQAGMSNLYDRQLGHLIRAWVKWLSYPFTPKISFAILLTVCQFGEFGDGSTYNPLIVRS